RLLEIERAAHVAQLEADLRLVRAGRFSAQRDAGVELQRVAIVVLIRGPVVPDRAVDVVTVARALRLEAVVLWRIARVIFERHRAELSLRAGFDAIPLEAESDVRGQHLRLEVIPVHDRKRATLVLPALRDVEAAGVLADVVERSRVG